MSTACSCSGVMLLSQVATPRVAKAVKAEIPCVDDPVGKLEDIGDQTKKKLSDLPAAADICGAQGLVLPFSGVVTGRQLASHHWLRKSTTCLC